MIDTPEITQTEAQHAAVIRFTIPREEIGTVMGPGHSELMSVLTAQAIAPAGPWFSHHLRMDPAIFDFEVGIPVATPITASGRVQRGQLPAARVARTVYHGGYEGLGGGWGELMAWLAAEKHETAPDLWERYVAGPESGSDSTTWRTELNQPLI